MYFYALHDYDKTKRGMNLIRPEDAQSWNEKGYGIHWTPQTFKDGVRKLENLEEINYWLADIDTGDKDKTLRRIAQSPVQPTHIVETKRGYHVYWRAKNATLEHYAEIERGIAKALNADGSLITPTHTLRFPGFYHLKDPTSPFLVKWVWQHPEKIYSEELMLRVFCKKQKKVITNFGLSDLSDKLEDIINPDNWERYLHVSRIQPGCRNVEMNRIAYILLKAGADSGLMLQVLGDINKNLPRPLDYSELRGIVKGKYK